MEKIMAQFSTEQELVETAIQHLPLRSWLRAPKSATLFQQTEVPGLFGIPDLVAARVSKRKRKTIHFDSIAFEMKLSDWRRGLIQAFRYRAFATTVILVIDDARSAPAIANVDRFKKANVGLVGLRPDGAFNVYSWPDREDPFSPHLQATLHEIVQEVASVN
jgi:hypothetical protein